MWYKGRCAWGVRSKYFDKKQVFQAGGTQSACTKEQRETIVDATIEKMSKACLTQMQ